ncbi:MAG: hypothetical protein NTU44_15575, partial [Bacteroidetes bacterium]|nr:hypothetical protein [Bacteroidota bacterium]
SETLLIIGYSYADAHVDKLIQDSLKSGNLKKVINVNPFTPFPYSFGGLEIANFSDINELISHI